MGWTAVGVRRPAGLNQQPARTAERPRPLVGAVLGSLCGLCASASPASPSVAALERTSLVLGQPTPDAGVLAGLQRPLQAGVDNLAASTDRFGLVDLRQGGPGVPDREE